MTVSADVLLLPVDTILPPEGRKVGVNRRQQYMCTYSHAQLLAEEGAMQHARVVLGQRAVLLTCWHCIILQVEQRQAGAVPPTLQVLRGGTLDRIWLTQERNDKRQHQVNDSSTYYSLSKRRKRAGRSALLICTHAARARGYLTQAASELSCACWNVQDSTKPAPGPAEPVTSH